MESKIQERRQVVDALLQNAIVGSLEDTDDYVKVIVPGAIREENIVSAASREEAIEKVRQVLYSKEQSRLEGLAAAENAPQNVEIQADSVHVNTTPAGA